MPYFENLLTNPSAEEGLTGWTSENVSQVAGGISPGSYCFRLTGTGASLSQSISIGTNAKAVKIQFGSYTSADLTAEAVSLMLLVTVTQTTLVKKMWVPIVSPMTTKLTGYVAGMEYVWTQCSAILPVELTEPIATVEISLIVSGLDVGLYVDDFYLAIDESETGALKEGESYYGVTIGKINGLTVERLDGASKAVFNSDLLAFQVWDNVTETYVSKIYFDPVSGKYIFDGTLSATVIEAIEAEIDVIISNTVIVQNLYAELGVVARLTVDHVLTYNILDDPATMDYIDIKNNYIKFIHAIRDDGLPDIPYTDEDLNPLYWKDELHETGMGIKVTDWPVMVSQYDEQIKMMWYFDETDPNHVPKIVMGIGTDPSGETDEGKAFTYKDTTGLVQIYYTESTNIERKLELSNTGIKVANPGAALNLRNIDYQTTLPSDLSAYSIGDVILVKV